MIIFISIFMVIRNCIFSLSWFVRLFNSREMYCESVYFFATGRLNAHYLMLCRWGEPLYVYVRQSEMHDHENNVRQTEPRTKPF